MGVRTTGASGNPTPSVGETSDTDLGTPRAPYVPESGIRAHYSDTESRTSKGREVENKDIPSPKSFSQRCVDTGTWLPRDRRHREHTDTDTFLGNYSGNHTAVQARTPLSTPDSGNTACPQLQNPLLQVLDPWALPRSRPWPCPRRGALRVTVGRRQGRGREVGPMLTLLGSLTQLRAERPLPPARRGESAFLTTEMRTRPKLLTLTAACL